MQHLDATSQATLRAPLISKSFGLGLANQEYRRPRYVESQSPSFHLGENSIMVIDSVLTVQFNMRDWSGPQDPQRSIRGGTVQLTIGTTSLCRKYRTFQRNSSPKSSVTCCPSHSVHSQGFSTTTLSPPITIDYRLRPAQGELMYCSYASNGIV